MSYDCVWLLLICVCKFLMLMGGVRMLGIEQYKKIQKLKKIGLSKVKVSQQTNLSYKTICNYWNMNENYFVNKLKEHEFILVNYRQYII